MSSSSPPPGGRIQAILALLLTIFGPPTALISFAHLLNLQTWLTTVLVLVYEILAFFVSFLTEVWQKIKAPWIETIANWIDQGTRSTLSRYHRRYFRYFAYEYRDLDVKGITTQGVYTLDLQDVFVELRVDPKAPHIASADPLRLPTPPPQVPTELRNGKHTIWEYLVASRFQEQHFMVLGPPGSGKTTLLKHLGLVLAHYKRTRSPNPFGRKLPMLLFLREHSKTIMDQDEYTLAEAIRTSANRWKYPMPIGWIEHRLARGQCLILLDGLDEVAEPIQRKQTVFWVERQMKNYGNNRFVLTSRPFGYRENPIAGVTILEVQPFTLQETTQFVMSWYQANEIKRAVRDDTGVRMKAEQEARDLLRRLREAPDLFDLAVNPLLLTMIATVHSYRGTLPGARVELYKEICEVFLGKRQEARGVVQDLRAEQRQLVLQPLAYKMMQQGQRELPTQEAMQIIVHELPQISTSLTPRVFLESIQNSCGLLLEREQGIYSFAHKTFQEYLASVHISKHGLVETLSSCVQNEWWHETIRLYCAQTDATPIIETCLNVHSTKTLTLALECEREALSLQPAVQRRVEDIIAQGIEGTDPELRHITAEVLLARRLRQMYALNDQTFIDTTLVTHAEYQLFLNEQYSEGRYYQPDHWTNFVFPVGQSRQPALGIRHSDAQAFCTWLSEKGGGVWQYRLPNETDLVQIDKDTWKNLSQDTCYWIEGERRFAWSQGHPSHSISVLFQATLTKILDHAHSLAYGRERALSYGHKRALVHDRERKLDLDLTSAINSVRDRDLALDLDLACSRNSSDGFSRYRLPIDMIRDLTFLRTRSRNPAFLRDHTINLAFTHPHGHSADRILPLILDLYIQLFLLQERREQRLPAWEGILLVKEHIFAKK